MQNRKRQLRTGGDNLEQEDMQECHISSDEEEVEEGGEGQPAGEEEEGPQAMARARLGRPVGMPKASRFVDEQD
ncbi:hypothetical protein scyTo_0020810 [Scyliorhinus torazame]|uniref:Uncharacterized protein n=1 Tax=Scyliorhinus torazame TaxID=75743 RepID=A0A401PNZ6_SCYTO|nr:hypothetical protein [Scyliorhinus torazame]